MNDIDHSRHRSHRARHGRGRVARSHRRNRRLAAALCRRHREARQVGRAAAPRRGRARHAGPHRGPLPQPRGRAALRLADAACFEGLRAELERRHYKPDSPTCVQVGSAQRMRQVAAPDAALADIDSAPDDAWAALFPGRGVRPGGRRAPRAHAGARQGLALCQRARRRPHRGRGRHGYFGHGWASVHGMRTDKAQRGRGTGGARAGRAGAGGAGATVSNACSCRSMPRTRRRWRCCTRVPARGFPRRTRDVQLLRQQ
jgi:hypothetical protein